MRRVCTDKRSQLGATTLLVAGIILPVLFFLFTLSLDASRYIAENTKIQKSIDEIALYAYRFLPYKREAEAASRSYLRQYGEFGGTTDVRVDSDSVSISFAGSSPLTFPTFFGLAGGIPITAYARARGTPFDTYILLDASSYMGPAIPDGRAWGSAGDWPAASFFANEFPISQGTQVIDARIVTQQCFNSPFLALKRGAIHAYEYLSSFSGNAVGVGVYPGSGNSVDHVREVVSVHARAIGPGEADFNYYMDESNRNELCAAAAEREHGFDAYRFLSGNRNLEEVSGGGEPVQMVLPDPLQGNWTLNPEFESYLRMRHVLWSQARRQSTVGDFAEALRDARAQVIGSRFDGNRGGLSGAVLKSVVVFAGDIPHVRGARFPESSAQQALANQFAALRQDVADSAGAISFRLLYVLFRHEGNSQTDLEGRLSAWREFLAAEGQKFSGAANDFRLDLVYFQSADQLSNSGVANMLLVGRSALLSR